MPPNTTDRCKTNDHHHSGHSRDDCMCVKKPLTQQLITPIILSHIYIIYNLSYQRFLWSVFFLIIIIFARLVFLKTPLSHYTFFNVFVPWVSGVTVSKCVKAKVLLNIRFAHFGLIKQKKALLRTSAVTFLVCIFTQLMRKERRKPHTDRNGLHCISARGIVSFTEEVKVKVIICFY